MPAAHTSPFVRCPLVKHPLVWSDQSLWPPTCVASTMLDLYGQKSTCISPTNDCRLTSALVNASACSLLAWVILPRMTLAFRSLLN
jgi:hypothetical protein